MPRSYCADIVRNHDYDRYLCALFAPVQMREAWLTLFAFNYEIAVIPEIVSEEMVGFVRFAWWRDALDKIYAAEKPPSHPVAEALAKVIYAYRLPRVHFDTIINARMEHWQQKEFSTTEALQSYCRDTSACLLQLCAIAANLPPSALLEELGIAWAYIGILRTHAHHGSAADTQFLGSAEQYMQTVRTGYWQKLRIFAPFVHVCDFYLKRLRSHKTVENLPSVRAKLIAKLLLGSLL